VGGVVATMLGALALGVVLTPGPSRARASGDGAMPRLRIAGPGDEARLQIPYVLLDRRRAGDHRAALRPAACAGLARVGRDRPRPSQRPPGDQHHRRPAGRRRAAGRRVPAARLRPRRA
jgi:hypothetical protein